MKSLVEVHPFRRVNNYFSDISTKDLDSIAKNYILYVIRTLRFIFAVERNRKVLTRGDDVRNRFEEIIRLLKYFIWINKNI